MSQAEPTVPQCASRRQPAAVPCLPRAVSSESSELLPLFKDGSVRTCSLSRSTSSRSRILCTAAERAWEPSKSAVYEAGWMDSYLPRPRLFGLVGAECCPAGRTGQLRHHTSESTAPHQWRRYKTLIAAIHPPTPSSHTRHLPRPRAAGPNTPLPVSRRRTRQLTSFSDTISTVSLLIVSRSWERRTASARRLDSSESSSASSPVAEDVRRRSAQG